MGNLCTSCPYPRRDKDDTQSNRPISVSHQLSSGKADLTRKIIKKHAILPDVTTHSLEAVTALVTNKPKSSHDREVILKILRNHMLFSALDDESRELALNEMRNLTISAGELICKEGTHAVYFFILVKGRAEVREKGRKIREIGEGEGFGDAALLHDTKRMNTIKALTECELWGIERKPFRRFMSALSSQLYEENSSFIESIRVFAGLTPSQRQALVQYLHPAVYLQGQSIVTEGTIGDWLYIIKSGEVVCSQGSKELRRMQKGEFFGEQALLYGGYRTASVTALTPKVTCLYISAQDLSLALGDCMQSVIYLNSLRIALEKIPAFSGLLPSQMQNIVKGMRIESFDSGTVVVEQGTQLSSGLWVVLKGSLRVNNSTEICTERGGYVGIDSDSTVKTDIVVATDLADIASLTRLELEHCIGGSLSLITTNNAAVSTLRKVQLLRPLPNDKLMALSSALHLREYQDKQLIVQQGQPGDAFFIIKSGCVEILIDDLLIREQGKLDYFGERSILFSEKRTATVRAKGEVVCWVLEKVNFKGIIQASLRAQLVRRIELQDTNVQLSDLSFHRLLGRGMFGLVTHVSHKRTRTQYALKSVPRSKVSLYDLSSHLLLERKIMLQIDHNLIIKLIRTFKDTERVYFLMEYVRGLDFFDVLRLMGLVNNEDARFYAAALVTILDYLHSLDIVYRDLKPENVLIDEEGYPKLIDFGTAKVVSNRTYSVVGTPHYMAPEVIMGQGYSTNADYWSLGVLLYEMICGEVPFAEDQEDPYAIYEAILERKLVFPSYVDGKMPARMVVDQLLSQNPAARTHGNAEKLKNHKWFAGFSWEKLESRELKAPFLPNLEVRKKEWDSVQAGRRELMEVLRAEEAEDESGPVRSHTRVHAAPPIDWDSEF